MDVIGPVPTSQYGEEYILVIQDMLSRWVELAPMKKSDTATILDKFMICWVSRYGPPQRLLTDRASTFTGAVTAEFCRFFGIDKIHTTAYRPQGNGANERVHQELTKYFSMYLDPNLKSKWRWLLQDATWVLNTSYHSALRMTPYEAMFGEPPPIDALGIPVKENHFDKFPVYYGVRRKQLMEKRQQLQQNLAKARNTSIHQHNSHSHKIPYKIGDYVLYKNNRAKKWDEKYFGPWKIISQISPVVFELNIDNERFTAHAAYLKPYKGSVQPTTGDIVDEELDPETPEETIRFVQHDADNNDSDEAQDEQNRFTNPFASPSLTTPARGDDGPARQAIRNLRRMINFRRPQRAIVPNMQPQVRLQRLALQPTTTPDNNEPTRDSDNAEVIGSRPRRDRQPVNRYGDFVYF
jgi:hypothetical protein